MNESKKVKFLDIMSQQIYNKEHIRNKEKSDLLHAILLTVLRAENSLEFSDVKAERRKFRAIYKKLIFSRNTRHVLNANLEHTCQTKSGPKLKPEASCKKIKHK